MGVETCATWARFVWVGPTPALAYAPGKRYKGLQIAAMDYCEFMRTFSGLRWHLYLAGLTEAVNPRSHRVPEYRQRRNELGRIVYEHNPDRPVVVEQDERSDLIVGPLDPPGTAPFTGYAAEVSTLSFIPYSLPSRVARTRILVFQGQPHRAQNTIPDA